MNTSDPGNLLTIEGFIYFMADQTRKTPEQIEHVCRFLKLGKLLAIQLDMQDIADSASTEGMDLERYWNGMLLLIEMDCDRSIQDQQPTEWVRQRNEAVTPHLLTLSESSGESLETVTAVYYGVCAYIAQLTKLSIRKAQWIAFAEQMAAQGLVCFSDFGPTNL